MGRTPPGSMLQLPAAYSFGYLQLGTLLLFNPGKCAEPDLQTDTG